MKCNYKILPKDDYAGGEQSIIREEDGAWIPLEKENRDYQEYLENIKIHGMSIVTSTDCWDGIPNDSMWQYLDNAEQLLTDKYGSDPSLHDKMTALREDRYVRAMKAETPYESMKVAGPVIDTTPQEIKDKYRHLPMRR
tara:strand:- start:12 stop:428 length:417 start_codon:yes stop_codon:yes gene_type:complete